jgi:hypothetical protein
MDEWARKAERGTACFVTMIRTMVEKEHGLPMPIYDAHDAHAASASASGEKTEEGTSQAAPALGVLPMPPAVPVQAPAPAAAADADAAAVAPSKSRGKEKSNDDDDDDDDDDDEGSITLVALFDKRARQAASTTRAGAKTRVGHIANSHAILQQPHYSSEGLAKCLLAINTLTATIITHCDKVSTRHVDEKNAAIVRLLSALTSYKLSIVQSMVDNKDITQTSAAGSAFMTLFKDAKVTLPLPPSSENNMCDNGDSVQFARYGSNTSSGSSCAKPPSQTPDTFPDVGGGTGGSGAAAAPGDSLDGGEASSAGAGLLSWASSVLSGGATTSSSQSPLPAAATATATAAATTEQVKKNALTKAALMSNRLKELRGLRKEAENSGKGKENSPVRAPAPAPADAASDADAAIDTTTTITSSSSSSSSAAAAAAAATVPQAATELHFRWMDSVVLYYCSVLVGVNAQPGTGPRDSLPPAVAATLYITQHHLCLYLGIPSLVVGFNKALQGLTGGLNSLNLTPTKSALLGGTDAASTPAAVAASSNGGGGSDIPSILPLDAPVSQQQPQQQQQSGSSSSNNSSSEEEGTRLVFPLSKLRQATTWRSTSVLGVEQINLYLSFYEGNRSLVVRPMVEEVERLRLLLSEIVEISSALNE